MARLLASGATFDGRPLQPRHVAVLADVRSKLSVVAAALERRGVATVLVGSGSVLGTPAGRSWLTLLEAMAQPHRSALVRAAALTPFLGRSAEDLDRGGDAVTAEDSETLRGWSDVLRQRGPSAVLELAGADGRLAARVLGRTDGARLLTDLRHTTELLDEAAAEGRTTAGVLATWLARQRAEDLDTVSADRVRRMDSDAAAVHLMTIHASKGLQFPVVYAPSLSDLYAATRRAPALPRRRRHAVCRRQRRRRYAGGRRARGPGGLGRGAAQALRRRHPRPVPAGRVVGAERTEHDDLGAAPHRLRPPSRRRHRPGIRTGARRRRGPTDHRCLAGGRSVLGRDVLGGSAAVATEFATYPGFPRRPPLHPEPGPGLDPTSYTGLARAAAEHEAQDPDRLRPVTEPEDPPRADEPPLPGHRRVRQRRRERILSPMAELPVGATFGSLVHAVLEHADPDQAADDDAWRAQLRRLVDEQRVWWPVDLDREVLTSALVAVCDTPLGPLAGDPRGAHRDRVPQLRRED